MSFVGYSNNQAKINSGDTNNVGIAKFFDGRARYNGFEVAANHNFSLLATLTENYRK